jgi:His/Glu/Gln/Arg/opine family amino acid ABC transporter permease subunit
MSVDLSPILNNWRFLWGGIETTLLLSIMSIALGVVVGMTVGIARCYAGRYVRALLALYVDSMRAIPQLVILVWVFFALPLLTPYSMTPFTAGVIGIGMHLAAFVSEVVRAGLLSIRPGQMQAALAIGMSRAQAVQIILLPQALIRMIPAFGSLVVITIKDSAIASVIAVPELMHQSQIIVGKTYRPFEVFTVALIIYFILCWPVARGIDRIYRRLAPLGAS